MTPELQIIKEEEDKEFQKALDVFKQTQGENLQYQELLQRNPRLKNCFIERISDDLGNSNLDLVDLLLSKDQDLCKINFFNESILRNMIENFDGNRSVDIISKHISKFASIKDDKDSDNNNLIASFLIGENNQESFGNDSYISCVTKLIKILVENGVSVDDINSDGKTPLDLCFEPELFKTLAQYASPKILEKKLRHIIEEEEIESPSVISVFKFLLIEKEVKIDLNHIFTNDINISFFYDIVKEHGNEEQKKFCHKIDECKKTIESFLSPASIEEEDLKHLDFVINFIPNELLKPQVLEKIITRYPKFLETQNNKGLNLVSYAINQRKWDDLESIIIANPQTLDLKNKAVLNLVFNLIHFNKLDLLKTIIEINPEILKQNDGNGVTPVFYAILNEKLDALKIIIKTNPEILKQNLGNGFTLVFYAIYNEKLNALKTIIEINPEILKQNVGNGVTPVFYAILNDKLYALKTIIKTNPEILKQNVGNGFTPVFYAIYNDKLDALKAIIKTNPEILKQNVRNGFTPVFYAIRNGKLNVLKTIIETNEGVLDQQDQQGNNPILYSLGQYYNEPSDLNKNTLKLIFQKQFGRDLQDEEIKNLSEFVGNYKFLKLFYDKLGQPMHDKEFKSRTSSILPSEEELESELSKKLLKIYQIIAEAKEKPSIIECHDANGDKTELHIYKSQLNEHASYFIFHVNAQNKLTKISYCDGHEVFLERRISRQIGANQSTYINGATTFELKESLDFSPQFAEDFVNKNSKGKTTTEFCLQHFSRAKLESKEIFGCKFLGMTHSTPTKMQIRGNCPLKSFYVVSRHSLEIQHQIENSTTDRLFTYDEESKAQGGEGYKSYKDLRQKMVDKAGEKLFQIVEILEKNFLNKIGFFEKMNSLMDRSLMKEKKAKPEKSTTKLLQTTPNFIDQINRNKLFKDNLVSDEVNHQKHFNLIATSHLNLSQEDVDKIKFLFEKQEVKIDDFLAWNFQTTQAKNNFVKLLFEHGDEGKKESFNVQLLASNPEKRDKFFKDLSKENLSLIITEFEKQKSKFGNLEQVIEGLKTKQREDPHGLEDFMSDATFFNNRDAKNNFVKEIGSGSSEERKDAFIIKFCSDKSEENRNKFLNGLDPQCLGFMLRRSQAQLGKLKNVEKIIKELQEHVEKIDSKLINFEGFRVGDKRSHDEMTGSFSSEKTDPSSSIYSAGGSSASSEKMVATSSK